MKKILFCCLLCLPFVGFCQKMPQADDAVREFVKTVQRQDTVKLSSLMTGFANFQVIDFDSDVKQVLTKSYQKDNFLYYYVLHDERKWFKEDIGMGVSLVNGGVATQWVNYLQYYSTGEMSCGNRVFQSILVEGGWKITQMIETRFKNCKDSDLLKFRYTLPKNQ